MSCTRHHKRHTCHHNSVVHSTADNGHLATAPDIRPHGHQRDCDGVAGAQLALAIDARDKQVAWGRSMSSGHAVLAAKMEAVTDLLPLGTHPTGCTEA